MPEPAMLCPRCTESVALRDAEGKGVCPVCGLSVSLHKVAREPLNVSPEIVEPQPGPASPPAPPAEPNTVVAPHPPFSREFLGHYEFVELLGQGGMGSVYLMRQVRLDRLVAVKVVKGDDYDSEQVRRLLKEARVLAGLNHPNIVSVFDVGSDGLLPYIVCEYVEGASLAERLKRPPALSLRQALLITMRISDGLRIAHEKGIVHRDLKPANIFLTRDGKPKIGDFGLAKAQTIPSCVSVGRVVGTPPYMSPEQCTGRGTSLCSDIYSAGVMLFEMVTGRPPFLGPTFAEFLYQHAKEPAPMPRSLKGELPEELDAVIARALSKEPKDRFQSAVEFKQAVQSVYRGLTTGKETPKDPVSPRGGTPPSPPRIQAAEGARLVDRYELVRLLGEGGMGHVWLAKDLELDGQEVAVKLVSPELWRDADARAQVKQEARLTQKLSHPNVVRLFCLEPGETPFLVMEYVDGPSLADELGRRKEEGRPPLSPEEALPIVEAVAAALDHAHERNVIHRDLKPGNIILESFQTGVLRPKLADFGIAAEMTSFKSRLTGVVPAGTLAYMSPEQQACQKLDGRSDVYALAATTYQMLTLRPPFEGGNVAWAIANAPVPYPDGVPEAVARVVLRGLSKDPSQRQTSCGRLALEFRQAVLGVTPEPTAATLPASGALVQRADGPGPSPALSTTVSRLAADGQAPSKVPRRPSAVALLLIALFVGACGAALVATGIVPRPGVIDRFERASVISATSVAPSAATADRPASPPASGGFDLDSLGSTGPRPGSPPRPVEPKSPSLGPSRPIDLATLPQPLPTPQPPVAPPCAPAASIPGAEGEELFRKGVRFEESKQYGEAFRCYRKASELGHRQAQNCMGVLYDLGLGVARDAEQAAHWYRRSAEKGYVKAQKNLAHCLREGSGVMKSPAEAFTWYRRAADQGDAGAQNAVGFCYQRGEGAGRNVEEAVQWYRRAAELGHAAARVNMGLCCLDGLAVLKDETKAVQWFRLAADQGYPAAQNLLGACYGKGLGLAVDPGIAVQWYRKAADQGYALAQHNLAVYYEIGAGVPKEPQTAVFWYRKAARGGNAEARQWLANQGRSY